MQIVKSETLGKKWMDLLQHKSEKTIIENAWKSLKLIHLSKNQKMKQGKPSKTMKKLNLNSQN
jgi:hypothetical protein